MSKKNIFEFYDIETLSNLFTYTGKNLKTGEVVQFTIWKNKNELIPFLQHLSKLEGQVGYNNLKFDYPVIHYIMVNYEKLVGFTGDKVAKLIYKKAQDVISKEFSEVKQDQVMIRQLDLFRIWHFDNKARITSLKKLEINMNFPNVQDMPYHHSDKITSDDQVKEILDYNINDVNATEAFYEKTISKLDLRKGVKTKYGIDCLNFPDTKIGEQLMLKLYCDATNKDPNIVKRLRTFRNNFKFSECVPSYVKYYTDDFKNVLNYIIGIEVPTLKDSFKYSFTSNNFQFDMGTGGIHGCCKSGVYEADGDNIIIDSDVGSLYPSLAIANHLYPEHLGEEFFEVYEEGIVKPRLKAKKEGDKVMADGFKLSANSVYGKSNSEYSFLCDPLYTLKTTLAGQLSLLMLSELLFMKIPNIIMLQINTDGLTTKFDKQYLDLYLRICEYWENQTKLVLEHVEYSKMVIRDVNNYSAVSLNEVWYSDNNIMKKEYNSIKYKGAFKDNHAMRKDGEWHKSFSQGIVATAVNKYFLEGIKVEDTVKQCEDIYEFCKTANSVGNWKTETYEYDENNNIINRVPQQKNNRYYVSNKGCKFRKYTYKKDTKTGEDKFTATDYESNNVVTIFNVFQEKSFSEYDVNYEYYINECYKIIHVINGTKEKEEEKLRMQREKEKMQREEHNYIKYCVNKVPTERQFNLYSRDWLLDKYGLPKEIKITKTKNE